ncbi:hypothetical protein HYPSUDRAFT_43832 [Hypholoma sublateritium FD-334 SS-4]|uniref:Uncharacterized protein n=1 Tax=Hypholoma sublateritium (strain FD-334 SS-4) TaxID=945553 RepID=A0A0D2NM11_HYPSF|nr:hypothetical protein HYPSUDRAFT_43832 [Hypholoma sublateritium FD-334 SS-4]
MGVFGFFSYTSTQTNVVEKPSAGQSTTVSTTTVNTAHAQALSTEKVASKSIPIVEGTSTTTSKPPISSKPGLSAYVSDKPSTNMPKVAPRRFSLRPFSFSSKSSSDTKPALSASHEQEKRVKAGQDYEKRSQKVQASKSDKVALQSALAIRSLIVGPTSTAASKTTPVTAKPQLNALKTQLMQPKSANKLIMHLRTLPAHDEIPTGHELRPKGPIHAVCLEHTDEEEHQLHFAKLGKEDIARDISAENITFQGVTSAPLEQLTALFNEMHVVDLVSSPDFGLGQPGNGKGILAGAVPTAKTVIDGFTKITPELMALGYATGKAVTPDHSGMHPPTDRISILTYWWGLELCLPPPTLLHLAKAQSVSGSLMNFLSALAIVNNGVREILPFIRYISQYVDFEFSAIKAQDKGHGVVCAATWIMPAALVPRPWDFPLLAEPPTSRGEDSPQTTPDLVSTPASLLGIAAQSPVPPSPAKSPAVPIKTSV